LRVFVGRLLFVLVLVIVLVLIFSGPRAPQLPSEAALVLAPAGVVTEQVPTLTPADLVLITDCP